MARTPGEKSAQLVARLDDEGHQSGIYADAKSAGGTETDAAGNTAKFQSILDTDPISRQRVLIIPFGTWETNALTFDRGTATHSYLVKGDAPRIGNRIKLASAAANALTMGNGDFGMFHVNLENFSLDGNDLVTEAALKFDNGNFIHIDKVHVEGFDGAIGLLLKPGDISANPIIQEVSILNSSIMQEGSGTGLIGIRAYITGNCDLWHTNVEKCTDAINVRGINSLPTFTMTGGRIERIDGFALDLSSLRAFVKTEATKGAVFLDSQVVASEISLGNAGGSNTNTNPHGICDNGFGNAINQMGGLEADSADYTKSVGATGHYQDGKEWLRVPGLNPFPVFEQGNDFFTTASNCTVDVVPNPLAAQAKGASALRLTSTAAGGYIDIGPFPTSTGVDLLGLVGVMANGDNYNQVTISLRDSVGEIASKAVSLMDAAYELDPLKNAYSLEKVLATLVTDTEVTIRIALTGNNAQACIWVADVKPSESRHLVEVSNFDSTSGSGGQTKYRRALTSTPLSLAPTAAWPSGVGMISRGLIDVVSAGTDASFLSVGGTSNSATLKHLFRLPTDNREWTMYTPYPTPGTGGNRLSLWSFGATTHTVDLYETSLHKVFPIAVNTNHEASAVGPFSQTVILPLWVPDDDQYGMILSGRLRLEVLTNNTGTATDYWAIQIVKRSGGGALSVLWQVNNQSATWSQTTMTTIAANDFTSTVKRLLNFNESLAVRILRVGTPSNLDVGVGVSVQVKDYTK